jgi:hypothetical protein
MKLKDIPQYKSLTSSKCRTILWLADDVIPQLESLRDLYLTAYNDVLAAEVTKTIKSLSQE